MMVMKRLGNFLFVIGALILIVFTSSVLVDNSQYGLLLGGLILVVWGVIWMRKGSPPPTPTNRFGLFRRHNHRDQQSQDKG
jgi:hypothetical protein